MSATSRNPTVSDRLREAIATRSEPLDGVPSELLEQARQSTAIADHVALGLFEAVVALQQVAPEVAAERLAHVAPLLEGREGVEDQLLHWWYHHTRAEVEASRGDIDATVAAYEQAIRIAENVHGTESELERSYANLLYFLQRADSGSAVAQTLLRYLRSKKTTELWPYFYLVVSDALYWLGEYEQAYTLRSRAMRNRSRPLDGALARDHRELARCLLALDRVVEAGSHLSRALRWVPRSTAEQAILTHLVAAELFAARGDLTSARQHLSSARALGAPASQCAPAVVSIVAGCHQRRDFCTGEVYLDELEGIELTGRVRSRLWELRAEAHHHAGDYVAAIDAAEVARRFGCGQRHSADTIAEIRSELIPWMAVAGGDSHDLISVDEHRGFRSRWLSAAASDLRRSIDSSTAVVASDSTTVEKINALEQITDDLRLTSEFLAGLCQSERLDQRASFWQIHDAAARIVERAGARLFCDPPAGSSVRLGDEALAGRLTFGLVALIADHLNPGSIITVEVDRMSIRVSASGIGETQRSAIDAAFANLGSSSAPASPRPATRAAFLAVAHAAVERGWCFTRRATRHDEMAITIGIAPLPRPGRDETSAADQSLPPIDLDIPMPDGPPELIGRIRHIHENRFVDANLFDPSLVVATRKTGNIPLHASSLLVSAGALTFRQEHAGAGELLDELWDLIASHPELEIWAWPGPIFLANREMSVVTGRGEFVAKWRSLVATLDICARARIVALLCYETLYFLARIEVDRGDLRAAWNLSQLCDPLGISTIGRSLELSVRAFVFMVEGRWAEAEAAAADRYEIARSSEVWHRQEALQEHARALIMLGRFDEAHERIDELALALSPIEEKFHRSLRALAFFRQGRDDEALSECRIVRAISMPGYDAVVMSTTVPIEAELLRRAGRCDEAQVVLDEFGIDKHRIIDLPNRFAVEKALAATTGSSERHWEIVKQHLDFDLGRPRFCLEHEPLYPVMNRAVTAVVNRDRERLRQERSVIAEVVAHDLRNALSTMTLVLEMAHLNRSAANLDRVSEALAPIETLANQLEEIALLSGAVRPVDEADIDVIALTEEVIGPIKASYERGGGELLFTTNAEHGVWVRSRGTLLAAIIRNLVGNAAKHGRRDGTIIVKAELRDRPQNARFRAYVAITVDDDGPGLSEEERERFRNPDIELRAVKHGLGLGVIHRYAVALGFEIDCQQSPMGGARFVFKIYVGEQPVMLGKSPARASHKVASPG